MTAATVTAAAVTASWWTDPDAVAANAAGRVTPAQYALVAGRRILPPYLGYALMTVWAAMVGLIGVASADNSDYGPRAVALGMLTFGALSVPYPLGLALANAVPRWRRRRRRRRRLSSLAACRIAGAVGEIGARPDGVPEALVGASRLALPKGSPELPPPGAYRLYWLESAEGGPGPLLLSAEPLDRQEAEAPSDSVPTGGQLLLEAMGLTQGDLATNRAGRLTVRQRRSLVRAFCRHAVMWGVGTVAWFGLFLAPSVEAVGTLITSGPGGSWFSTVATLLFCLAFSAFFCGMGAAGVWAGVTEGRIGDLWHALRSSTPVRCAVGEVSVRGSGTKWWLSGDRLDFAVAPTVAQTFLAPGPYALHHLPGLGILLSAEPAAGERAPVSDRSSPTPR